MCLDMYKKAIGGMRRHMLTELWMGPDIGEVWIAAENDAGASRNLVLEHLTCFLPGTMALGGWRCARSVLMRRVCRGPC